MFKFMHIVNTTCSCVYEERGCPVPATKGANQLGVELVATPNVLHSAPIYCQIDYGDYTTLLLRMVVCWNHLSWILKQQN